MTEITGREGQVLADRYRLVTLIGRGGMGCVWRAEHLALGTPVAIKLVHASVATRPGVLRRFVREAQAAARLRSVNVVQIFDHGVDGGVPYIAMECLEGESFAQRLDREGKLGAADTAMILSGVCRALARAHRMGVIHRDLKPDNVFIARDESGPVVKVLDFGIAKVIDPGQTEPHVRTDTVNRTAAGAMLGTPCYMSPEQARRHKKVDERSDLWSLGVIAFECLTGRRPFEATVLGELICQICVESIPTPSSIAAVPRGFDAWFARAMEREPDARFQTVRDFADALADVLMPGQRWLEALGDSELAAPAEPPAASSHRPISETGAAAVLPALTARPRSRRPLVIGIAFAVASAGALVGLIASTTSKTGGAGAEPTAAEPPALIATAPPSSPQRAAEAPSALASSALASSAVASSAVASSAAPAPSATASARVVKASGAAATPSATATASAIATTIATPRASAFKQPAGAAPSASAGASPPAVTKPPDDELMHEHK